MMENWKDILGYEGLYQVSDYGRVRTVARDIIRSNGERLHIKERIRKIYIRPDGYAEVHLRKEGKGNSIKVHRLVAEAFIPNPNNLPMVNHKDETPSNNKVDNLEWCDREYNVNYGTCIQRMAEKRTNGKKSKAVIQYTVEGIFVKRWPSCAEIERVLGYGNSNISACCRGKHNQVYGFKWAYE